MLAPIEVIQDKRLTLKQTRVLLALFSFRGKVTNIVWPSRQALSKRTGMLDKHISTTTTELVELGWLKKTGNGGRSKVTKYTLCMPDCMEITTVPDSGTVSPQNGTRSGDGLGAKTVPDSGTKTVPDSGRGKEHTKEQTNKSHTARASSSDAVVAVCVGASPKSEQPIEPPPATPSLATAACVAMRAMGMASVNPSSPKLKALIESGAGIDALSDAAKLAVERGKGFAYALSIVQNQMADAARILSDVSAKSAQSQAFAGGI